MATIVTRSGKGSPLTNTEVDANFTNLNTDKIETNAEVRAAVEAASDSNVFTDADHTKLNAIEASATADQTAAEILTAIKTVDGAGSGLDADTLDGIASADIARKVWYSSSVSAGTDNYWAKVATFSFNSENYRDAQALYSFTNVNTGPADVGAITLVAIGVRKNNPSNSETNTLTVDILASANTTAFGDDSFKLIDSGGGTDVEFWVQKKVAYASTVTAWLLSYISNSGTTITYNNNAAWQSSTPTGSGLNVLSAGLRYNDYTVWHSGNDGTGSGLDADTLDGVEAAALMPLSGGTFTGNVTLQNTSSPTIAVFDGTRFGSMKQTMLGGLEFAVGTISGSTYGQFVLKQQNGVGSQIVSIKADLGAAVELYHLGTKKLETTASGIDVTGTVQADQFNNDEALPDIRPSLLLDFANSKTLDPRITFTRGSTATYYDGHTTAKAEENLLTYSQELDNGAWGKNDSAVSANSIAAPDGTTTADTVTADGGSAIAHGVLSNTAISSAAATVSVYAKKGSQSVLQILFYGPASNIWQNYNLDNGSLGSGNSSHAEQTAQSITDVGNGWYRCTVSGDFSSSNATDILFAIKSSATSVRAATETNSGTIYLWGAQLEQRSAPTAYTATTSAPIVKYQPTLQTAASGLARFDHDPVTGESKGLLVEEARTNLFTYSSEFDNAEWNTVRTSVDANVIVAPDGTLSADKLVEDTTASNSHYLLEFITKDSSVRNYTASVYLKAAERTKAFVYFRDSSFVGARTGVIDLSAGTIGDADISTGGTVLGNTIEDAGNGWYRVSLSMTSTTNTSQRLEIYAADDSGNITYTGDGYSGVFLWGAQMEEGSFPTSYIPTSGSTVTRAVDSVRMLLASFAGIYNPTESTMFSEFSSISDDTGYVRIWDIGSLTTNNNRFALMHFPRSSVENITMEYRTNNTAQASLSVISNTLVVTNAKVAATWAQNDFAAVANGGTVLTDGTGSIYSSIPRDTLGIGNATGLGNDLTGHLKKLAYYPKRLSNATLQAMTTE